jgi:hypothetical protein
MSAYQEFWNWFVRHEPELFALDSNRVAERESVFDELAIELQKVSPHLTFELGPNAPKREFVISAGGIQSAFRAVVSLANAAPVLTRWRVTAFRPRRAPVHIVEFADKRVDPDGVQFSLRHNGKIAGIHLFIPGFREGDANWKQIGYLLLDGTLGEYDVEFRLGLIKMFSPDARTDGNRHPLAELPALFDQLVSRLEKRSRKPS